MAKFDKVVTPPAVPVPEVPKAPSPRVSIRSLGENSHSFVVDGDLDALTQMDVLDVIEGASAGGFNHIGLETALSCGKEVWLAPAMVELDARQPFRVDFNPKLNAREFQLRTIG